MENRKITVGLEGRTYPIIIGRELFNQHDLLELSPFKSRRYVVVTNDVVGPMYFNTVATFLSANGSTVEEIVISDGERFKTQGTLTSIYDQLLAKRADRGTTIVALGGGVVGDVAGYAAATYRRGVPLIQIPTTLLSQVDSSVGGKTAINHPAGKNMIGAFYQPQAVIVSLEMLESLPDREFHAGLAEVIKYGAIMDEAFFVWLEENVENLLRRDYDALGYAVERCCACKAKVVEGDETELGLRALLNFGHTFGHAIEAHNKYKGLSHGAAVTLGMVIAAKISFYEGYIRACQLDDMINLIESLGLNIDYSKYSYNDLKGYVLNDKKVSKGKLNLILINNKGKAFKTDQYKINNLRKAFI